MEQQETSSLDHFWFRGDVRVQLLDWIDAALLEDRAVQDLTARLFQGQKEQFCRGVISARQKGVVCGTAAMCAVFERLDPECQIRSRLSDGESVATGTEIMTLDGPAPVLFAGERIALNICAHLSGIATRTSQLVERVTGAAIYDTRKTIPGLRSFQKQAVRSGGGVSHRADLAEFPMVKENHREWIQTLNPDLVGDPLAEMDFIQKTFRDGGFEGPLAIEVEDEQSFQACLSHEIEIILVDNTDPHELELWIERARQSGLTVRPEQIEASGGIDESTVGAYGAAGAGRISSGAITHSAKALDLTMYVAAKEKFIGETDRGGTS
ncbi:MAG: carboxylating nicotinate-nucleotide diphosphorylase [Planctomycetota bacterium]